MAETTIRYHDINPKRVARYLYLVNNSKALQEVSGKTAIHIAEMMDMAYQEGSGKLELPVHIRSDEQ